MSTLFVLIFLASIIWFFIALRKDKKTGGKTTRKTWYILIVAVISFMLIGSSAKNKSKEKNTKSQQSSSKKSNSKVVKNSSSSVSKNSSSSKSSPSVKTEPLKSRINSALLKHLTEDQGFANGTLDENGKPLPNGETRTPNDVFAWSKSISKMVYYDAGTDAIKIYFTEDAMKNLSKSEGLKVAQSAQSMAAGTLFSEVAESTKEQNKIEKMFDLDTAHKMKPYVVLCDNNGNEIARTSAWDNQFKPKDFQ
ncbi:hypothetical protein EFS27_09600 [Leuconostoc mesenteroides]|uniref:hypothetical protein n=1 Tax=Leuconostoc mesenteroides TaxID=1245 RepID=UPI0021A54DD1|nr:hypothetical protein [Leuconostoc mesenteroides]MCT3039475.1 hypothetical protein [Leuconostoc mesenteroides]